MARTRMKTRFRPDPQLQGNSSRLAATTSQATRRRRIPGVQIVQSGHIATPRGSYTQVPEQTRAPPEASVEPENQPLAAHEEPAPYFDLYELYQPAGLPEVIGSLRHTARFKKEREWERWKSTLPHLVNTYRQLLCTTDSLRQQPTLMDHLSPCLCASAKPSSVTLVLMDSKLTIPYYSVVNFI